MTPNIIEINKLYFTHLFINNDFRPFIILLYSLYVQRMRSYRPLDVLVTQYCFRDWLYIIL